MVITIMTRKTAGAMEQAHTVVTTVRAQNTDR